MSDADLQSNLIDQDDFYATLADEFAAAENRYDDYPVYDDYPPDDLGAPDDEEVEQTFERDEPDIDDIPAEQDDDDPDKADNFADAERLGYEGTTRLEGAMGRAEMMSRTPIEHFKNKILMLLGEEPKYELILKVDSIDTVMNIYSKVPSFIYMNTEIAVIAVSLYLNDKQKLTKKNLQDMKRQVGEFSEVDVVRYYRTIKKHTS